MTLTTSFDSTPITRCDGRSGRFLNVLDSVRHREQRISDLQLFEDSGLSSSRYYTDWEMVSSPFNKVCHWEVLDKVMDFFKTRSHQPFFEFLHHVIPVQGRTYADSDLPEIVERFALNFIARYPWTQKFCIINELQFSTLASGFLKLWPPFGSSYRDYLLMLINGARTICYVANSILKQNPKAEFLLPETCEFHTPATAHPSKAVQRLINERNEARFWSGDLVRGKVDEDHPLAKILKNNRISLDVLQWQNEIALKDENLIQGFDIYTHSQREVGEDLSDQPSKNPQAFSELFRQYQDRYPQGRFMVAEINVLGTVEDRINWTGLGLHWAAEASKTMKLEEFCYYHATDTPCWNTFCTRYRLKPYPSGLWGLADHLRRGKNWIRTPNRLVDLYSQFAQGNIALEEWPLNPEWSRNNDRLRPYLPFIKSLKEGSRPDLWPKKITSKLIRKIQRL